jgi:hypothetical protein
MNTNNHKRLLTAATATGLLFALTARGQEPKTADKPTPPQATTISPDSDSAVLISFQGSVLGLYGYATGAYVEFFWLVKPQATTDPNSPKFFLLEVSTAKNTFGFKNAKTSAGLLEGLMKASVAGSSIQRTLFAPFTPTDVSIVDAKLRATSPHCQVPLPKDAPAQEDQKDVYEITNAPPRPVTILTHATVRTVSK